jgi:hypothetical protein
VFVGRKEKAMNSWVIAVPLSVERPQPPRHRRFNAFVMPERRRIVAQVRRKVLKYRGFRAVEDIEASGPSKILWPDATIC